MKKKTISSHVKEYGDLKISERPLRDFFASPEYIQPPHHADASFMLSSQQTLIDHDQFMEDEVIKLVSSRSSRNLKLQYLKHQYLGASSPEEIEIAYEEYQKEAEYITSIDIVFTKAVIDVVGHDKAVEFQNKHLIAVPKSFDCLRSVNEDFIQPHCRSYTDYSLKYVRSVVQMCEYLVESDPNITQNEAAMKIGLVLTSLCDMEFKQLS